MGNNFMNEVEMENHFFDKSRAIKENLTATIPLKIYEGADFLLYHWDVNRELHVSTSYMVTDISVNAEKVWVTLMDKQTYKMIKVGNIPVVLGSLGSTALAVCVPCKVTFEKTIKESKGRGRAIEGLTLSLDCHMESSPQAKIPYHQYMVPHNQMLKFLPEQALREAFARQEIG